ncbi:hypothetical protein E1B28_012688 [Marasmius oreades]|uniref:Uncharacterized protein n=1 Tax=Marasmius oreades TaxID=181124 RepID=A0A9P7RST1_9AGAR|nr:uncharacterized protein E1B28_012688 [Marasmius oreades]KAG7088720.1 hypothetical protein E1B28_012688 [Marasmius oreades]
MVPPGHHPQTRNKTYPQPNVNQIGSGRNTTWNAGSGVAFSHQEPGDAVASVSRGFSDMSIHENPYNQTNPSVSGSGRSNHTQQHLSRNIIPIYAHQDSSPTFQSVSPPGAQPPVYNYSNTSSSSQTNSIPFHNYPDTSHQSMNAYQTRPSLSVANSSQQPPQHPATYFSDRPIATTSLHRTFSRQSINTSPTQYEPVPFEGESRPPPMLHRTSSRHSLDGTTGKPLKGILKNGSSRTPSEESLSPRNFAPVSPITPDTAKHTFRRSWSTSATVGSATPADRQRVPRGGPPVTDRFNLPRFIPNPMSPGASSSSTGPFLDLEHEPRSRYPTIPAAGGYQSGTPIFLIQMPPTKKHHSHKEKDGKHHKSKEGRSVLTKSKDKDKDKEKQKKHSKS